MLNNPVLEKMMDRLKEANGARVIIGVQGEPGTNFHGQTVSANEDLQKIAYVHEYGYDIEVTPEMRAWLHYNDIHLKPDTTHIHIPERSYIRRAHAEGKSEFQALKHWLEGELIRGNLSVDEMLDQLGKDALNRTFSDLGAGTAPVTEYTLKHRKESPNPTPLTDTGNLQNHITYRIAKKGAGAG